MGIKFFDDGYRRAANLLGTDNLSIIMEDEFTLPQSLGTNSSNGGNAESNAESSDVCSDVTSSAVAGQYGFLQFAGDHIANSSSPFYMRFRFRLVDSVPAGTQRALMGLFYSNAGNPTINPAITFGVSGPSNTGGSVSRFSLITGTDAGVMSGVQVTSTIDSEKHIVEIYRAKSKLAFINCILDENDGAIALSSTTSDTISRVGILAHTGNQADQVRVKAYAVQLLGHV